MQGRSYGMLHNTSHCTRSLPQSKPIQNHQLPIKQRQLIICTHLQAFEIPTAYSLATCGLHSSRTDSVYFLHVTFFFSWETTRFPVVCSSRRNSRRGRSTNLKRFGGLTVSEFFQKKMLQFHCQCSVIIIPWTYMSFFSPTAKHGYIRM